MNYIKQAIILSDKSSAKLAKVGAVIVKNDEIVAKAYNADYNYLYDELEDSTENGLVTKPDILHAEERAIADCARVGCATDGAILVVTLAPCFKCARLILASGVKEVIYKDSWWDTAAIEYLERNGVKVMKYKKDR